MPHDANGIELHVGDKVFIPATVIGITNVDNNFCNIDIEYDLAMPAYPEKRQRTSNINSKQLVKHVQLTGERCI